MAEFCKFKTHVKNISVTVEFVYAHMLYMHEIANVNFPNFASSLEATSVPYIAMCSFHTALKIQALHQMHILDI